MQASSRAHPRRVYPRGAYPRGAYPRRVHTGVHFLCLCAAMIAVQACGAKTDADSEQPPDTEAPSAPTELTAHAASGSSVDLNWKAATDNVGVVAYRVYRSDAASFVASVTSTTYADTGLASDTAYNYAVRAVDAAGNESTASNTATISTLSAATGQDVNQITSPTVQAHSIKMSSRTNEYGELKRLFRNQLGSALRTRRLG